MRKINKLGKRAAALVLAVGLTLSTAAPVLAVDADEVQTPAAQTEQQEETEELPAESDADSEEPADSELPAESDADSEEPADSDKGVELPADSEERKPVVVLPDQQPADSGTETPAESDAEKPAASGTETPAEPDADGDADTYKYHWWYEDRTVAPTCTAWGYTHYKCHLCSDTKDEDWKAPLGHNLTDWIIKPETCTTAGKRYKACQRNGCNYEEVNEDYAKEHPALGHDFEGAEWIIEPATCTTAGKRYQVCQHEGCTEEKVDPTYAEEHPALGHAWGEYVDDDKPGCQQQTETAHCTREGCTATDTRNLPNFGSDGNPLPHKFTKYEKYYETKDVPLVGEVKYLAGYTSTCDYGCGETKKYDVLDSEVAADGLTDTAMDSIKLADKTADEYATAIVNEALTNAQNAVKNAKSKDEAIAALDQISSTVRSELRNGIKVSVKIAGKDVNTTVKFTDEQLDDALRPLDEAIDSLKSTLDDSFLSQDTITNVVDKLAGDVKNSDAPKNGINQIIYNTVYDAIYNIGKDDNEKKKTDNDPAIENMVLQLVRDVVNSEEGWQTLTDSLVDDALNLAVDELMKDETYAKLLKTKLGAATLDEVKVEVKKQLAEDPTFMNNVRGIAEKAASNAQKGVNAGWSDEKIMSRLQADLLPDVADLVSNQIDKLGAGASEIVDNKVSDTVHKFLPGKLGDWVSDKIGGKVSDAVTGKVNGLNKDVTDLITSSIKQLTCGKHEYGDFEVLKNPTCTEKGQKGKICKKCGKITEKTDIPATGHTPVTDPAVAPTETTDGLTEGSHCSTCGAVLQAQEVIPMLDPTIDTWFSRAATTEADAKAAGFDSVDAANAALDAALTAAGFDPADAEHFTVQVNSSIGVLPNDRFPESGVTGKLTLPEGTRGKTAQTYYAVQMFTADTRFHKAGDVVVTPVSIDTYAKTGLQFTVYSEAVMAIAWKAQ